jgi:hypothetical protein
MYGLGEVSLIERSIPAARVVLADMSALLFSEIALQLAQACTTTTGGCITIKVDPIQSMRMR